MRFLDEMKMWYSDTEDMARRLSNKSEREVQKILDKHDVICLRSGKRPKVNILGRLLLPFVWSVCVIICSLKWVITGDRYLDSVVKKYKFLDSLLKYTGLKE